MKVLHFYKTFSVDQFGGVETFIRHLTHATASEGCENTVLSLSREPSEPIETDSYRLVQARQDVNIASTGFSFSAIGMFSRLAREADLIHYHFPWPFMDVVHFASRIDKPSVVTYHSDIVRQKVLTKVYRPLMNAFLGSVDAIVASSPNYLDSSCVLQKFRAKSCAIPIGLEQGLYPAPCSSRVEEFRRRYGGRFFLFVGVLRYYKGLHLLLEAMRGQTWPLVIAGAGPLGVELAETAKKFGLHNVHFLGEVDEQEKIDLLEASYALIFPSHLRSEAFGISLLEGAMLGKPMVCCEIGTGTSYINQHEVSGLVVAPANAAALREAMNRLWLHPQLALHYGKAARERYLQIFTAHSMGREYASLYRRVSLKRQST